MAISKVKLPDNSVQDIKDARMGNARIFYGTCNSDADYINKTVVCPDFTSADLVKGAIVFVTFSYTNSSDVDDGINLNVNNTGYKPIKYLSLPGGGVQNLRTNNTLRADCTYLFAYDGTNWVLLNTNYDYDTTYSIIDASEAQTGTSGTSRTVSAASLKRDIEYRMSQNQPDWNESTSTSPSYIKNKPSIQVAVVTTQPSGGFAPNVLYNLGTLTGSKTFTLASPSDNTIVNHYYWTFTAGSTAPIITWPSGISWFGGSAPTITAGKHYDVSILDNIAVCMEV